MSQAGIIDLIGNNPSIPTEFEGNTGTAIPLANVLRIIGDTTQGLSFSGSGNTLTGTIANATTTTKGVSSYNSADFSVTAGAVSLVTPIAATKGGTGQSTYATGDILYASAPNTLSKLAATTNGFVLTLTGGVPVWAASAGGGVSSVSGTANRITSTGGANPVIDIAATYVGQNSITTLGTITTGVWNASVIPLAYGGTNANLTASNGGIFYSTATAGAILSGTATAGRVLRSGASSAPSWSTATYPATTTANQLLYSSSANIVGGLTSGNNKFLSTNGSGVPSFTEDYITGTWTPVLSFGGATTGISYLVQEGYYAKIGTLVYCAFYINLNSKGTATGIARLEGLPVTVGSRGYAMAWNIAQYNMSLNANYTVPFLSYNVGATTADIYMSGSGQTPTTLQDTNFSNSSLFSGAFIYATI